MTKRNDRYSDGYGDSRATKCCRGVMVFGNLIFCMLGCAVIVVGVYLLVERIFFLQWVYGTQLPAVTCYLIITAGVFMFLVSFVGCFGTLFQYRRVLLIYCFVLVLIFMLSIVAATIAIVCRVWVSDMVKVYMRESLLSTYGTDMKDDWHNLVTRSWDEAQEKLQCCSIDNNGWSLYRQTFWYKDYPGLHGEDKPYVPASCCKRRGGAYLDLVACQMSGEGPPGLQSGIVNNALYYTGCFEAGKSALYPIIGYFIAIGFFISSIVVIGIVCSLFLYSKL